MGEPAIVSLTFDDGLRCQFDRALPVLRRYSLPATFFLIANRGEVHCDGCPHPNWRKIAWDAADIQNLKRMLRDRHEIGAHSVTHLGESLHANPQYEAEQSKEFLEDLLDEEITSFAYPFFDASPHIKAPVAAVYAQARAGSRAPGSSSFYSAQDPIDWWQIDCRMAGGINAYKVRYEEIWHDVAREPAEDVKVWLRPGYWHVLCFHGVGDIRDGYWPISENEFAREMSELAEYERRGDVQVLTFKDGASWLRQQKHQRNQAET